MIEQSGDGPERDMVISKINVELGINDEYWGSETKDCVFSRLKDAIVSVSELPDEYLFDLLALHRITLENHCKPTSSLVIVFSVDKVVAEGLWPEHRGNMGALMDYVGQRIIKAVDASLRAMGAGGVESWRGKFDAKKGGFCVHHSKKGGDLCHS